MRYPRWNSFLAIFTFLAGLAATAAHATDVLTFHNDDYRSGWNNTETTLTRANVSGLALQKSVALDAQVDAQPLVVTGQAISGQGTHDVVYVATENDTVYAIDAYSGQILLTRSLGTPVPMQNLPGQCNNNSNIVGISSTPVIDRSAGRLFVMAYTEESSGPAYRLHALDLSTLADAVAPALASATASLTSGTYTFSAYASRQRAALLEANGNIYAGFASWCDLDGNISRGWLLGWNAASLAPLGSAELTDRRATAPNNFFQSSIWMSGSGPVADSSGNIYFATGNSDQSGKTFNKTNNPADSILRLSPDLSTVEGEFFPTYPGSDTVYWHDVTDNDLGGSGLLLIPPQPNLARTLIVGGGDGLGPFYVLDANDLGLNGRGLAEITNNNCWCTHSYFTTPLGYGRLVTSSGNAVTVYRFAVGSTGHIALRQVSQSQPIYAAAQDDGGQNVGFFTSVSSNGTKNVIVWAVSRPTLDTSNTMTLYAINPAKGSTLTSLPAGTWPYTGGNANTVPVVANGHVYVASYQQLAIFGLGAPATAVALANPVAPPRPPLPPGEHGVTGIVTAINGTVIQLQDRNSRTLTIDLGPALRDYLSVAPRLGRPLLVRYRTGSGGTLVAVNALKAKSRAFWEPDQN